ncbi:glycosyltransferase family 2 protein [Brevundimonas sp. SORGH_AS_0993]|uniref:glycosyltransferase family 2 protein n=1 Tax=Brevundimonas sp. SORGH_AS_0993 TaxID=3041794 RepID=UPI0027890280|nr:glycosyltransferase family 2 protein [Brevundimonas sp. SORGH_AS_0993]MDQ1153562.1 cellulose synthase/poly-beta-1,6-N-acetylglucosamine synthase-like glycosyltransferase [Brevundimonas sp. SORGH_AS_0993]
MTKAAKIERPRGAARRSPTLGQILSWSLVLAAPAAGFALSPSRTVAGLILALQSAFAISALWRATVAVASLKRVATTPPPTEWPRYTVLAALHDEAAVTPQLIASLARLDYAAHRLEGFLVLEAHDHATLAAAEATPKPDWLKVVVAPPGHPLTKPRALNHALTRATGDLVTIYDAEDRPDPDQLRAAAARFAAEPRLGCLQAPLRIRPRRGGGSGFLDRQFAFEYAALFEVMLPGMARLGLPFPLGGTSNHVRMEALRAVGGWDAYNVTEDADLGFRLWSRGWTLGLVAPPTQETPPGGIDRWLPQRTRWIKGYMQTWGVHTRRPADLRGRGLLALAMTLGAAIISAAAHAPTLAWLASAVLIGLSAGVRPEAPVGAIAVLMIGVVASWTTCAIGARRAGLNYRLTDMLAAPAYWALLSLAFVHALWRLVMEPHVWDKTPHDRDEDMPDRIAPPVLMKAKSGREAA